MNPKFNPNALAMMWGLTLAMAGAITIGHLAVYIVAGLVAAYTIFAVI